MNTLAKFIIGSCLVIFSTMGNAFIVVSNEYINHEAFNLEILYNVETNSGTLIARDPNCTSCDPITMTFSGTINFSIEGVQSAFGIDSPMNGVGDFSYHPEDMTVGHINMYE